jgi:hypothetical protein
MWFGLAHIYVCERVSEANSPVAKPEVGGGLEGCFDGQTGLVSGRCLGFAKRWL